MDRIHLYLSVFDFDPAPPSDVTALLGIDPTTAWMEGEPVSGHPTARRTFSSWQLKSPLPLTTGFEEQMEALLRIMEDRAEQVRLVNERFGAQIGCAAYFQSVNPGFGLSADHCARIAVLGLSLDFDLYCLPPAADAEGGQPVSDSEPAAGTR